jgi:MFS family permease
MTEQLWGKKHLFQFGLWSNSAFLKLWSAQTISFFGSQITLLALPLTATVNLQASAPQMALLRAADVAPALLSGLLAGTLIDRFRRRPILIVSDIGRALLIGSIPLASYLGLLSMSHLYVVAFLGGILSVFFDVAHMSLLPTLLPRDRLVECNSKLEVSRSVAMIAGVLVQLLSASIALIIDAFSFLGSALFLLRIPESPPPRVDARPSLWTEAAEGFNALWSQPLLRTMALSLCVFNFFYNMIGTVYVLYVIHELHIAPATLGLIYTIGSIGFVFGAILAGHAARRFGVGPTIVWSAGISDAAFLLIPLVSGQCSAVLPLLITAQFLATLAGPVTAINQLSLRQAITPNHLQGRVNATMRVIALGAAPVGALFAGLLGDTVGVRPTLAIGAVGIQLGFAVLLLSPLRTLRQPPQAHVDEQPA